MKHFLKDKRVVLFWALLALVSLVALGSALKDVSFLPSQPIGFSNQNSRLTDFSHIAALLVSAAEVPFWRQITFWAGVFVIVLLISSLLSPELRKQLIQTFLKVATFSILLLYVIKNNSDVLAGFVLQIPYMGDTQNTLPSPQIAPPVFQPPRIPTFLSFLIAFGLILLGSMFLWILNRWWEKQKELRSARQPLKEIADIARLSLKDIEAGQDSRDAIIQCYERMSSAVGARRGLQREYSTTPAEFASRLERAGLPREPITRLTRLFESVRYGGRVSGATEINEAVSCLTSILKYCGETQ